jgi:hypothetical protein
LLLNKLLRGSQSVDILGVGRDIFFLSGFFFFFLKVLSGRKEESLFLKIVIR